MEENKLFHDRYFLERLLGRGNFSEVWLAKDTKTDIHVALKIYAPATGLDDNGLNIFAREFSLVVNANHKNLLKPLYYDTCERKPYLVLPYCKNGSIMKSIGQYNEEQTWHLLRDVASGLAWLHGLTPTIIHQDIKPDNIMIGDNGNYMITDFGVSTHLRSVLRKSMSVAFSSAGTIAYMAPERFGEDNTPIMANDIYSLGATAYEMLTGDTPFGDSGGLLQKKGADVPMLKGNYSAQLKSVIARCLKTIPWERPTAEQLEAYAETALKGGTIKFVDEKRSKLKHYRWVAAILALVVVGIVAVLFLFSGKESDPPVSASIATDTIEANTVAPVVSEGNAEERGDSIFKLALELQENMTLPSQKEAIKAFEEAKAAYQDDEKKQLCDQHIQTSKNIIKSLYGSNTNQKGKAAADEEASQRETVEVTEVVETAPVIEKVELSVSPTTVNLKGKGGKPVSLTVYCSSQKWSVSKAPAWITYSVNGNTIIIEAEKNPTKAERSGYLTVKCSGKTVQVNIIQARIKAMGIF